MSNFFSASSSFAVRTTGKCLSKCLIVYNMFVNFIFLVIIELLVSSSMLFFYLLSLFHGYEKKMLEDEFISRIPGSSYQVLS